MAEVQSNPIDDALASAGASSYKAQSSGANPIDSAFGGAAPAPSAGGGSQFGGSEKSLPSAFNPIDSVISSGGGRSTPLGSPRLPSAFGQEDIESLDQQKSVKSSAQDSSPDDPWYKRAWDFANTPTIDAEHVATWMGRDPGKIGGLEHGFYDLLSGLTSPLQIALTIGTLGTGSLWEAGGAAALKGVVAAEDLGQVAKGSQILSKFLKAGKTADEAYQAMPGFGVVPNVVRNGLEELAKKGLTPDSLINSGFVRQAGGAMLRAGGMTAGEADRVAKWVQFAVDAGFTVQNAYAAAVASPRVFDAIKEGDYETAKRLAVDAAGSGVFAFLGGRYAFKHHGELMPDAAAKMGLRVKPSEENARLMKLLEPMERDKIVAYEREKAWAEGMRRKYKDLSKDDMQLGRFNYEAGSENELAKWHNMLVDASGRGDKVPELPREWYHGTSWENADLIADGGLQPRGQNEMEEAKSFLTNNPRYAIQYPTKPGRRAIVVFNGPIEHLDTSNLDVAHEVETKQPIDKGFVRQIRYYDDKNNLVNVRSVNPDPDAHLNEIIDRKMLANKKLEYIDSLLAATDPRRLNDRVRDFARETGEKFKDTLASAMEEGSLRDGTDNYVTRIWKDPENETIKRFRTVSSGGSFNMNTKMALHRVFNSTVEGLLKGYELADHDPVALASHNANEFARIKANREALSSIADHNIRATDGRPMTALSGGGHVIEGDEDTNPGYAIQPRRMQSIRIADKVIQGLKRLIGIDSKPTPKVEPPSEAVVKDLMDQHDFIKGHDFRKTTDERLRKFQETQLDGLAAKVEKVIYEANDDVARLALEKAKSQIEQSKVSPSVSMAVTRQDAALGYLHTAIDSLGGKGKDTVGDAKVILDDNAAWKKATEEWKAANPGKDSSSSEARAAINERALKLKKVPVQETELDKLIREGKIVKYGQDRRTGKDLYAWATHDYRTIDNPAFRGWKVPITDNEGNPIYLEGEMRAHPEAEQYLNRRFGTQESIVKKIPGLKTVLGAGREAKGLLLFVSPFHAVQEGLRAIMTGISPFGTEKFNAENPVHIKAAEKGVWEGRDHSGARMFEEGLAGHSKVLQKIPGLAQLQHGLQSFLFDRYIPGLKLRAFGSLWERYKKLHPDWTEDRAAEEAADETNERFGGLPYKRMGRAAGTMDAARLLTLAPDWLESEVRFMARMFGDEGTLARRDMAKMTLYLWGASRILNYLISGKAHNEAPFGVAWKDEDGREKVYSVRTMPTDMLHAVSDPGGFIRGRVSPLVRVGTEAYTGRDEFGRKLSNNNIWVNMLRNVSPIPAQSLAKKASGEQDVSYSDAAVKAAGLTVFPYRTEAQKTAASLASDRSEAGPVDPTKLRRHQTIIELENRVRTGQVPANDIYQLVESGQLHPDEAKNMMKTIQATAGMDNDMARLYAHVSRLPMSDVLKVWDKATNQEKASLAPLFTKKKQAYMRKAIKEMSPDELRSDPTYQRLRSMFPQDPPWGGTGGNAAPQSNPGGNERGGSGTSNSTGRFRE